MYSFSEVDFKFFLFRLDGQVGFVMKLFFLSFSHFKTVVDFVNLT